MKIKRSFTMKRWLKYILKIAFIFFLLAACNQQKDKGITTIYGNVKLKTGSYLKLIRIDTAAYITIDSVKPGHDGSFSLVVKPLTAGFYFIKDGEKTLAPVVIYPGDSIYIEIKQDSINITGGIEAGLFERFRKTLLADEMVVDSLGAVLVMARDLDNYQEIKKNTDSAWTVLIQKSKERGIQYLTDYPEFLSQILVVNSKVQQAYLFDQIADSSWLLLADSGLMNSHAGNPHAESFHNRMDLLRKNNARESRARESMKPGRNAPSISLPGLNGNMITLNPSKNKMTLVYFWSPSDGPSRKANHELKPMRDLYKSKGFEVFAVSLDQYPDRWKAAVNLDKLWWINVNEIETMNADVVKEWHVKKLPVFVLIDHQGKIVERFSSVNNLKLKLADAFGQ